MIKYSLKLLPERSKHMAFDFKKEYKELYLPKKEPVII